jgi:hypothetical protein
MRDVAALCIHFKHFKKKKLEKKRPYKKNTVEKK